ncbi:MAG: type II toxin-antitoxin system prevent-host-death family antitoxin [Conexibacteraceae bacterium]|nr:type II toxin-antitoxin system prevent-host-death family antitoxin [Conexibacteraceae bacterium]
MSATVSVRDLRNHGGEVLARVEGGETLTVTSHGRPVAELRPLARPPLTTAEFIERARQLPPVDPRKLRADIDAVIDQTV